VRTKSRIAFREEMERAEAFGINYLVTHMGAISAKGLIPASRGLLNRLTPSTTNYWL